MGAVGYALKPVAARASSRRRSSGSRTSSTQKLRRVLVVEDDALQRESTAQPARRRRRRDRRRRHRRRGARAARARTTFDCMVLDLTLPDMHGLRAARGDGAQDEPYSFPPVIVYTGRSLTRDEEQQLRRYSRSIIIKGARSPERLLDEVTLFLHQVEAELPPERQRMLRDARDRERVFEGRRILLVEDDVRNIFALTSVLEPQGRQGRDRAQRPRGARAARRKTRHRPRADGHHDAGDGRPRGDARDPQAARSSRSCRSSRSPPRRWPTTTSSASPPAPTTTSPSRSTSTSCSRWCACGCRR